MWLLWFFFFKQKTAYEMRISDWSSDVCSSDIDGGVDGVLLPPPLSDATEVIALFGEAEVPVVVVASSRPPARVSSVGIDDFEADRQSVVWGKGVAVGVDLGVRRTVNKIKDAENFTNDI